MNLITSIGIEKLTSNSTSNDFDGTYELLKEFIKDNLKYGAICTICKAYQLGVAQGKHNQRQINKKAS